MLRFSKWYVLCRIYFCNAVIVIKTPIVAILGSIRGSRCHLAYKKLALMLFQMTFAIHTRKDKGIEGRGGSWVITFRERRKNRCNVNIALSPHAAVHSGTQRYSGVALYDQSPIAERYKPQVYRAIPLIPKGPTQQKSWRPCWCSRQKSLIKTILNWNTNMAAVTSCANALQGVSKKRRPLEINHIVKI